MSIIDWLGLNKIYLFSIDFILFRLVSLFLVEMKFSEIKEAQLNKN